MKMMSYAENHEDVLLDRLFPEERAGFYIDVGANDPVYHSVTKHFSERGWRGINVEPGAADYAKLCADRPRDINLNVGVSDREGALTFHESPQRPGWSTFSADRSTVFADQAVEHVKRTVPVTTLASLCARHAPATIDFLKVDVEGHEHAVIAGGDWSRWRPRAVVVEANDTAAWEPILLAADYLYATTDGLNRYYLRREDEALAPRLAAPVSVLDGFVHFGYHSRIEELSRQLAELGEFGPDDLAWLRRMRRLSRRLPKLASAAKRVLRLVG